MSNAILDTLQLYARGQLSKEATLRVLATARGQSVKLSEVASSPYADVAKMIALQAGVIKGIGLAENLGGKAWNALTRPSSDALFQKLMQEHPSMVGKDPQRSRANFDYLMKESPHLADHPMILGDYIGNMTSMKTTDPATIKTIAETEKARTGARPQASALPGLAAKAVGDTYMEQMKLDRAPSQDDLVRAKANENLIAARAEDLSDSLIHGSPAERLKADVMKSLGQATRHGFTEQELAKMTPARRAQFEAIPSLRDTLEAGMVTPESFVKTRDAQSAELNKKPGGP